MLTRESAIIPFSTEALKANLLRLQTEWKQHKPAATGVRSIHT